MADTTAEDSGAGLIDPEYKEMTPQERRLAGTGFHLVERLLLILVAAMTLGGVVGELHRIWVAQDIQLADILMMFIYTEVIGMVAVFYTGQTSTFVFPIFIAITASARLIILQGKEMAPENIVFEASAILLLTLAATMMVRLAKS